MSENNLTYYCPICILDFSNVVVTPFQCLHVLCDNKNSTSKYKCPLCKSNVRKNSQYYIDYQHADKYQQTDEYQVHLSIVRNNWVSLNNFDHQTDEMCKIAVQQNGYALKFVNNQTDEMCQIAVQQNGYALQFVHNQTDALQFVHMHYILYIICKIVVQKYGYRILHLVKNKQMK